MKSGALSFDNSQCLKSAIKLFAISSSIIVWLYRSLLNPNSKISWLIQEIFVFLAAGSEAKAANMENSLLELKVKDWMKKDFTDSFSRITYGFTKNKVIALKAIFRKKSIRDPLGMQ